MNLLPKNPHGCPFLILAPMEGVGNHCFRKALASVGGFDSAVREFLRVPKNASIKNLAQVYKADEITPFPLTAQVMGSDPELMAAMAKELENKGAPGIDLNCGCPSSTVTGRGAGSSLLKDPQLLYKIAHAMVEAVSIPVTLKMRSGYKDISLFKENLVAAEESGVRYITLHPRTKADLYKSPARWDLIAEAKSILNIPLVGNGDILTVENALAMLKMTGCDGLMIGRGGIINPFLFHQIKAHFSKQPYSPCWKDLENFLNVYLSEISLPKVYTLKPLMSFLFQGNAALQEKRSAMLSLQSPTLSSFLEATLPLLKEGWETKEKL
jgi:tRNA-dihydrouridine synthase C